MSLTGKEAEILKLFLFLLRWLVFYHLSHIPTSEAVDIEGRERENEGARLERTG
jgi:hypothetical protein